MIKNKKIIAICLTELHDHRRNVIVEHLYREFKGTDYKIIVFNSLLDFYNGDSYDEGSGAVFNLINYKVIDALVILDESFRRSNRVNDIIRKAKENRIPVVLVKAERDGCYCIMEEYRNVYEDLIRHVIVDHGITDTFFMAGLKGNLDSETRLRCYMNVLAQNNLPFDYSMVGYGDFWTTATEKVMKELTRDGKKPPRAIFCANDIMAMTVCDFVQNLGYKVPEDVIVTGFDGIEKLEFFKPRITTCKENIPAICKLCAALIRGAVNGTIRPGTYTEQYEAVIAESCGCGNIEFDEDYRAKSAMLIKRFSDMEIHEKHVYMGIDKFLATEDIERIKTIFRTYTMLPDSYICFKTDLLAAFRGDIATSMIDNDMNKLTVFSSEFEEDKDVISDFNVAELIPEVDKWLDDDKICIINTLYIEAFVCGYYCLKTNNLEIDASRVNRLSLSLNLSMSIIYGRLKQKEMLKELNDSAFVEPVSRLANLTGLEKWFSDFSKKEDNSDKKVAVCIYKLAQYKYVYENYGMKNIEDIIVFLSDTLRKCNTINSFIAHIGEDEFVVLNYENISDSECLEDSVDIAKAAFFSAVENYNASGIKEYCIDVNFGYTIAYTGRDNELSSVMKVAYGELYKDRLNMMRGDGNRNIDYGVEGEAEMYYDDLKLIIENELLEYHFQPIIDVKKCKIYAYEALMRSTGGVVLTPQTILAVAMRYQKLYEIEKMTLFGIMKYYSENSEQFMGKKLFINSIPGYFLKDDDYRLFIDTYGELLKYCVFEITEQDAISDEELNKLKGLFDENQKGSLAVDGYGRGHSNISNLLRYSPNIIKIDRFLIASIESDVNKQLFVANIVQYAKINNIKVVAEGVETKEELQTVIKMGVDYVQGFYLARPTQKPINAIPMEIKDIIKIKNK